MTTSTNSTGFPAPCFLATNRGFYRGNPNETFNNMLIFTSNIRQATVFDSFEAAEHVFALLLTSKSLEVASYCAVVTAVQLPLDANELLNPVLKLSGTMKEVKLEKEHSDDNHSH